MGYKDPVAKAAAYKRWRHKNAVSLEEKRRVYYAANREKILEQQRERKQNMPREKLLAQRSKYQAAHREKQTRRYHATRLWIPWLNAFRGSKQRAKKRNTPFTLTKEWCEARWTGCCELTGIKFILSTKRSPFLFSPSLDQIIPGLGYTPENSRFVLHAINALKGEGTDEQMFEIANALISTSKTCSLKVVSVEPAD